MSPAVSAPVRQKERITIIDTLRGVALLGILMMNIPYFSNPEPYAFNLSLRNEYSGPNYYTWWVVSGFFEGTMRAIFSMLFGAGCLLLLNRLEKKGMQETPADIYYRRLLWLFLFGLINAFILLWPGDILYAYSLCGLFLYPFRKLKAKHLLLFALAFMLFATVKGTYRFYKNYNTRIQGEKVLALEKQKKTLTEDQKEAKEKWTGLQEKMKAENVHKEAQKEIRKIGGQGYFGVLAHLSSVNAMIESKVMYQYYFFDIMNLLFLGMALFKWGVLTGQRSKKFYWILLLAAYGIGLPLSYWEHATIISTKFDPTRAFESFGIDFYQQRRTILALGHISVIMLLYKYKVAALLLRWLSRVGQMAFTNYLMQSIICVTIFYGFGFALFGKLQRYQTYYVVFSVWLFQIIFSNIWLQYFRFGPFEWAWRSLTYWKKQPLRRAAAAEEEQKGSGEIPAPALVG